MQPKVKLRPRQQAGFEETARLFREKKKKILEVAPPGFGKATLMSYMAWRAFQNGGTVLMFVHKKELVFNLRDRLQKQFGLSAGLILSGQKEQRSRRIQIGSVATMVRRDLSWLEPTLVMGDESHRLLTASQLKLYDEFVCGIEGKGIPALFFTATPVRTDKKKKFSDYCDHLLQLSTYRQEMEDRNLVPTRVFMPEGAASLEGVKLRIRFGEKDYDEKELSKRFSEERILKALYARWSEFTGGHMQTMIFNVDKVHNRLVCEYFRSKGIAAEYVDESTPPAVRDELVRRFKAGPFCENPIMVMCNIGLFCLDSETEVLTSDGWVGMDDMTESHKVANWSTDGSVFFENPKRVIRRPMMEGEKMVRVSSARMDIRVTGNHKMVFRSGHGCKWVKKDAIELVGKRGHLPVAGHAAPFRHVPMAAKITERAGYIIKRSHHLRKSRGVPLDESKVMAASDYERYLETKTKKSINDLTLDECRFIGFWIGDGSVNRLIRGGLEYILCQSSVYPKIVKWIESVASRCGFDYVKREKIATSGNSYFTWSIGTGRGYGSQKRNGVSEIIDYLDKDGFDFMCMDEPQLDAFIEGFWMADGNHGDGGRMPETITISNTNRVLLDKVQAAACCRGYSVTIKKAGRPARSNHNQLWHLRMTKGLEHVCLTKLRDWMTLDIDDSGGNEMVWCVESSSGNIVTRRNGRVCVTGNCEGLDAEWVKCVVLNYASKSFTKYIQSTARGSRPVWNEDYSDWLKIDGRYYKKELRVLDFGGNTLRHGKLEDYDAFGFDLDEGKKKGNAPTKKCPGCSEVIYASYQECPHCGHTFPVEAKKDGKKYADEVAMVELDNQKALQKLIFSLSEERRQAAPVAYLRTIALLCGYDNGWVFDAINNRGEEPPSWVDFDGSPGSWARFWKWVGQEEKKKGIHKTYLAFKERRLQK